MDMKEVMDGHSFALLGDTLTEEKYACRIKHALLKAGYRVYAVGKELPSLQQVPEPVDYIDLCIHPGKGLMLLQQGPVNCRGVVIQPGAESPELIAWLEENRVPYLRGCLLKGLAAYPR